MERYRIGDLDWGRVKRIEFNINAQFQIIVGEAMGGEFYGGTIHSSNKDLNNIKISLDNYGVLKINSKLKDNNFKDVVLAFNLTDIDSLCFTAGKGSVDVFDNDMKPLSISSSGNAHLEIKATKKKQKYDLSGASCMNISALADDMSVESVGASTVLISSLHDVEKLKFKNLHIDLSGAGKVLSQAKALNLDVRVSGAGHVEATALEKAKIKISGAGKMNLIHKNKVDLVYEQSGAGQFFVNSKLFKNPQIKSNINNIFGDDIFGDVFGDLSSYKSNYIKKENKTSSITKNLQDDLNKFVYNQIDEMKAKYTTGVYSNKNIEDMDDMDDYDDDTEEDDYYNYETDKNQKSAPSTTVTPKETPEEVMQRKLQEEKAEKERLVKDRIKKIL